MRRFHRRDCRLTRLHAVDEVAEMIRRADERHLAQFVRDVEEAIEVLPYTRSTAAEHAALLDHVRRSGKPRGAHDLIIAAHARQTGRQVASLDVKARFSDLPGVATTAGQ